MAAPSTTTQVERASPTTPRPTAAASFTLTIESLPSGVQVLEDERVLGTTPVSLAIEPESVRTEPRQLWLKRDGYAPYHIVQGPSHTDVKVVADLSPLPAPEPAEVAPPAAEPPPSAADSKPISDAPRPSSHRRARPSAPAKSEPSAPLPDPSEIRLER